MDYPQEQIAELKAYGTALSQFSEDGRTYFRIEGLSLPEGCTPQVVNAVLQPTEAEGYKSRVFFSVQIQSRFPRNWNTQRRLNEENWHAFSWNFEPNGMSLAQILVEHLKGFTRP